MKLKLALGSKRQAMLLGVAGARAGPRRRALEARASAVAAARVERLGFEAPRRPARRRGRGRGRAGARPRRVAAAGPRRRKYSPDEVPVINKEDFDPPRGAGAADDRPRSLRSARPDPASAAHADAPAADAGGGRVRRAAAAASADADAEAAGRHVQVPRELRPEGEPDRGHPAGRRDLQRPGRRHSLRQVRTPEGGLRVDRRRVSWGSRESETKRLPIYAVRPTHDMKRGHAG